MDSFNFNRAYNTICIIDELDDHEHTNRSMRDFIDDKAVVGFERRSMQATFTFLKRHDYIIINESNNLLVVTEKGRQFYDKMSELL